MNNKAYVPTYMREEPSQYHVLLRQLLHALATAGNEPLSVHELSRRLGRGRMAVHRGLNALVTVYNCEVSVDPVTPDGVLQWSVQVHSWGVFDPAALRRFRDAVPELTERKKRPAQAST